MTRIEQVKSPSEIRKIALLAKEIWTQHYTPIIGSDQVNYMLEKFQTFEAISQQITDKAEYYLLFSEDFAVGYFCIYPKEESLFLSKLYVNQSFRGRGIAKSALSFIENRGISLGFSSLSLTVNKHNASSIQAYEKMGFSNVADIVQDIGNGYVMDDFIMKKEL